MLELLIVISLLAVILSVAASGVFLSMRSTRVSAERNVANALASETLEAVRAAQDENWQNLYSLTKSTQHYYALLSGSKWVLTAGDETVTVNGLSYTRYFIVNNVSRDSTTRNIQTTYSAADNDPGTQQVVVTVTWSGGNPITEYEYFSRWRNKTCSQSTWTTGASGNTVEPCSAATYDVKDAGINVTGGLHLQ